jgi:integrase
VGWVRWLQRSITAIFAALDVNIGIKRLSFYLFASRNETPLIDRNELKALHATGVKVAFHALRRYRTETLRRARAPEDLIRMWLGHASSSVTDP